MPRLVPLLHPAAILRGRFNDEPAQITYLKRWAKVARENPFYIPEDINQLPPKSRIFPSLRQLEEFERELRGLTQPCLSFDIENAGMFILCIGLTQLDLTSGEVGSTVNVPIRLRGGRQAWSRADLERVVLWLDGLFSDESITKVGHNIVAYDIPALTEVGFTIAGPILDTMVLAHLAYPEMRKSLEYTSVLYLGAARWKHLVSELDEEAER